MKYGWWTEYCVRAFASAEVCFLSLWARVVFERLCCSVCVCMCLCVVIYYVMLLVMHSWIFTCMDVFLRVFLRVCVCVCPRVGMCACVRLIALVTQAVSHSHCSKLWVGEGHCGADRGDGKERGDGGWVGEKETEEDDNEKLKAARKWDVGLHSSAVVFAAKKKKECAAPWGPELSLPLRDESFAVFLRRTGASQL